MNKGLTLGLPNHSRAGNVSFSLDTELIVHPLRYFTLCCFWVLSVPLSPSLVLYNYFHCFCLGFFQYTVLVNALCWHLAFPKDSP